MKYQVMPELTPIEYAALKASIAERGILVPVEVDENGDLLDGHHRVKAWQELRAEGVKVPKYATLIRKGMTEEQKRNHARELNVQRRQLTKQQRAEVMKAMRADGASLRQIARATGVDAATVYRQTTGVAIATPERVTGADGKSYPATQQPKTEPPPQSPPATLFEPGEAEAIEPKAAAAQVAQDRGRKAAEREQQRAANAEKVAAASAPGKIDGRFSAIVIDPPWDWGDEGDINQFGRARPDYVTLSFDEIKALPVGALAQENAHLYLWITNRSLPKGFALLEAWGFRYITCITWVKPSFGMGNYFRGQTEHLLFGVRGSLPLCRHDAPTVFQAPRGPDGHSSKPDALYELVESCSPGPYLEMFSRRNRPEWKTWGENGIA